MFIVELQMICSIILLSTKVNETGRVTFTLGQDKNLELFGKLLVPFQKVINSNTARLVDGMFTCTIPGYYKFQVYSLAGYGMELFLDVSLNSDTVANLWARSRMSVDGTGNAVILKLKQHDTVQLSSRRSSGMSGSSTEIYTTFTGVQLRMPGQGFDSLVACCAVHANYQIIPGGMRVLYDTVHVDTNNAYDKDTGIYTVPSSGVYAFHFFSLAQFDKEVWQDLYRNEQYVCSLYGKINYEYASAGNTAILHLYHGDHIQVRAHDNRTDYIYGHSDEIYTSFSSYQLDTDLVPENKVAETSVYFSVGLSQSTTFKQHESVLFDKVLSEIRTLKYYNNLTGEFIAPKNGTYEFNFHALSQRSRVVWLDLYHNDRYIVSLRGHVSDGHAAGGNAAVINLNAGDVVYIRAHDTSALFGTSDRIYCTFSGVMLQTGGI